MTERKKRTIDCYSRMDSLQSAPTATLMDGRTNAKKNCIGHTDDEKETLTRLYHLAKLSGGHLLLLRRDAVD